jgi:hypothetical protein
MVKILMKSLKILLKIIISISFIALVMNKGTYLYFPDVGRSTIKLNIRLGENSKYIANDVIFCVLDGNDVIGHTSKNSPISNNYFSSTYTSFSTNKFNVINYY